MLGTTEFIKNTLPTSRRIYSFTSVADTFYQFTYCLQITLHDNISRKFINSLRTAPSTVCNNWCATCQCLKIGCRHIILQGKIQKGICQRIKSTQVGYIFCTSDAYNSFWKRFHSFLIKSDKNNNISIVQQTSQLKEIFKSLTSPVRCHTKQNMFA